MKAAKRAGWLLGFGITVLVVAVIVHYSYRQPRRLASEIEQRCGVKCFVSDFRGTNDELLIFIPKGTPKIALSTLTEIIVNSKTIQRVSVRVDLELGWEASDLERFIQAMRHHSIAIPAAISFVRKCC